MSAALIVAATWYQIKVPTFCVGESHTRQESSTCTVQLDNVTAIICDLITNVNVGLSLIIDSEKPF